MACNGGCAENDEEEEGVEAARSTDKCPRTANNGGAGSGVRDVLTFLYTDVSYPTKGGICAERTVLLCDEYAKW